MPDPETETTLEIAIRCKNPEAMVSFYLDVMGGEPYGEVWLNERPSDNPDAEVLEGHPERFRHYWAVHLGGGIVKLLFDHAPLDPAAPQFPHANRYGISEHCFHVPDAAPIIERCEAAGCEVEVPLTPLPPSVKRPGYYAYIHDPDGNRIELIQGSQFSSPSDAFKARRAFDSIEELWAPRD
jgi:catechol 2,3-dioxygenase-like lactoylglutathione lyase family enzyme